MNPICNILVIVDPTATNHPSIEKGALLAEKFGARLELFVCETAVDGAADHQLQGCAGRIGGAAA